MPAIGSDEWVESLDAVLSLLVADGGGDPVAQPALVVQQELRGNGATWHVVVAAGRARAFSGRHAAPDVTFSQDAETAAAINAGTLSAQTAFLDGRLHVSGAVARLPEVAALLRSLERVPATGGA